MIARGPCGAVLVAALAWLLPFGAAAQDCASCTARHLGLQALQAARATAASGPSAVAGETPGLLPPPAPVPACSEPGAEVSRCPPAIQTLPAAPAAPGTP